MSYNLNVFPYYDDFSSEKDFHQVLFRPGQSVQARELTTLQSILQDQVEKFGEHIFKNGSPVLGGGMTYNTQAKHLVLKDSPAQPISELDGKTISIWDAATGVIEVGRAVVIKSFPTNTGLGITDNRIIISEIFGDFSSFAGNNKITLLNSATERARVEDSNFYGFATTASINAGVFFIQGVFVRISEQTIIVDRTGNTPTKIVGIQPVFSFITENEDSSLLDNSAGFTNFSAPGAHRLKIALNLVSYAAAPVSGTTTDTFTTIVYDAEDFILLMVLEAGVLTKQVKYPVYSEIGEELARRTYDESGSYTVKPFIIKALNEFAGAGTVTVDGSGNLTGTGTEFLAELEENSIVTIGSVDYTVAAVSSDISATVTPTTPVVTTTVFKVMDGKRLALKISPGKAYIKGKRFETIAPTNVKIDRARSVNNINSHDLSVSYGNYVVTSDLATAFNFTTLDTIDLLDYADAVIGTADVSMIKPGSNNNYKIFLFHTTMNAGKHLENVRKLAKTGSTTEVLTIDTTYGVNFTTNTGTVTATGGTLTGVGTLFNSELLVGSRIVINNVAMHVTAITDDNTATVDNGATPFNDVPAEFVVTDTKIFESDNSALITPIGYDNLSNKKADGATDAFTNIDYLIRRVETTTTTDTALLQFSLGSTDPYEFYTVIDAVNYQLFERNGTDDTAISISGLSLSLDGLRKTLAITGTTFNVSRTYVLFATLNAENATASGENIRGKTYNTAVHAGLTETLNDGRRYATSYVWSSNANTISLNVADVVSIEKVYLNPVWTGSAYTGTDITSSFNFDNGQRDTHYDHATLTLKDNLKANSGRFNGNILVLFDYWSHTNQKGIIISSSYSDYSKISTYTSATSGKLFKLRDCIDFRPVRIIGAGGALAVSELISPASNFQLDISFYLSRRDRIAISPAGGFVKVSGISDINPKLPPITEDLMSIYEIRLNPYTYTPLDLQTKYIENKRYTMRDVGRLEKRIENLEYYTSLSLLEKDTRDLLITDVAGNSRFKNGFIVDRFAGHNIGDVINANYRCAIDYTRNELRPAFISRGLTLHNTTTLVTTANNDLKAVKKGELIVLPFETNGEAFVTQLNASGHVNVNPYSIFNWSGQLELDPYTDFWSETEQAPDVIINIDGIYDNLVDGSAATSGTVWDDWSVNWTGRELLSTDVSIDTSQDLERTTRTFVNTGDQTRTGVETTVIPTTIEQSLGSRVVDVSVVPYIRAKSISLNATSMKPNTVLFVFFDNIDVTTLVSASGDFIDGSDLISNAAGEFQGTLVLPNPTSSTFQFVTGDKNIRIIDDISNNKANAGTFAEAIYTANGVISTVEEQIIKIKSFEIQETAVNEREEITSDPITDISTRSTRTRIWSDPVAETFLVDGNVYPEGLFLQNVKIYFRSKDTDLPVTVQIRPTSNGYPHSSYVMPFASVTKSATNVNVPAAIDFDKNDGIVNSPTEFEFKSPVYLPPGEYAIVIISNSNNYEVYTADVGSTKLGKTDIISEQPYAGSFFKSQNASTWTAEQTTDLMFVLTKYVFKAASLNVNVYAEFVDGFAGNTETKPYADNTLLNVMKLNSTQMNFPSTSTSHDFVGKVVDVAYNNATFTKTELGENIIQTVEKEISASETTENFRYRTTMFSSNRDVSPVIDDNRVSLIAVQNLINDVTDIITYSHVGVITPTFGTTSIIGATNVNVISNEIYNSVFDGSSGSVVSTANDTITLTANPGFITGDRITYSIGGGAIIAGLVDATEYYVNVDSGDDKIIKLYTTAANAVADGGSGFGLLILTGLGTGTTHKLVAATGVLSVRNNTINPILVGDTFNSIDGSPISCTVDSLNNETNATGGGADTRYITRIVNLANESDYIKVLVTAVKPSNTTIKVYYKVLENDSAAVFNSSVWQEMIQEIPTFDRISTSVDDYIDFQYRPNADTSIEPFVKMAIKVVLLSSNRGDIPRVKNFRAIALDLV